MESTKYDDIRAYFDEEIPEAMARVADDPLFMNVAGFVFPGDDIETARNKVRACHTTAQVQLNIMYPAIKRIIGLTINHFGHSGTELIDGSRSKVFISNHRDIVLDAFLLQAVLHESGYSTTDITYGDNLLRPQMVADICRSNKMLKIIRKDDISPREFLENSKHLSEYLRMRLESGNSLWIAQRNGRTKDGVDATDQGVLKLFGLSGSGDFASDFKSLGIVPVAISYEYEPCDIMKTLELLHRQNGDAYHKAPDEDFKSILTGICSPKGDVQLNICRPVGDDEIDEIAALPKADAYKALTTLIDRRIIGAYHLHATNYIAHDILHGERRYADRYTKEQEKMFASHLGQAEHMFGGDETARRIFLGIYANPVDSRNALNEA